MKIRRSHSWNVSVAEAKRIQERLRECFVPFHPVKNIKTIAACDVAYSEDTAYGVVVVFSYPDLEEKEKAEAKEKVPFPYVPGYLTFREGPVLLKAFAKLKTVPDVVLFDGQGIAHPRRMGEAAHLGILLNCPSIGCAKSRLYGEYREPGKEKGSYSYLLADGERVGAALRSRDNTRPIFVSPGYKIDLKSSIEIVLECTGKYRIPDPLRFAHQLSVKAA
jgi:deoxyribonuclease V